MGLALGVRPSGFGAASSITTSVQLGGGRNQGAFTSAPAATRGGARNHALAGFTARHTCRAVAPSARGSLASAKARKSLSAARATCGGSARVAAPRGGARKWG